MPRPPEASPFHQADFPLLNSIWTTTTSRLAGFESRDLLPSASLSTRGKLVILMNATLLFLPKIHQKLHIAVVTVTEQREGGG